MLSNTACVSVGPVMQTAAVMGIVFAAFVIGVSLTGALWYIYSSTGDEISFPPSLESDSANTLMLSFIVQIFAFKFTASFDF